jgi:hypothetical protein
MPRKRAWTKEREKHRTGGVEIKHEGERQKKKKTTRGRCEKIRDPAGI